MSICLSAESIKVVFSLCSCIVEQFVSILTTWLIDCSRGNVKPASATLKNRTISMEVPLKLPESD